jgi:hypothetical protein
MPGFFAKVIKGILIGGGTVLSILCPPLAPVGVAVIAAGANIPVPGVSDDVVTNYATATGAVLQAGQTTANVAKMPFSIQSLLSNPIAWIIAIGALLLLIFKPFKRLLRRRRR